MKVREKGVSGSPFYRLWCHQEDQGLVLKAHPLLVGDDIDTRCFGFKITKIWPDPSRTSNEVPVSLYYRGFDPTSLRDSVRDIIKLASEARSMRGHEDEESSLNACLFHQPIMDERLSLGDAVEVHKRFGGFSHAVIPVQFFHIDVELPEEFLSGARFFRKYFGEID